MGCMRSSKLDEGLNFHLRMMVQMMAVPAMHEATTIRTVYVVLFDEVDARAFCWLDELEGVAALKEEVLTTVTGSIAGAWAVSVVTAALVEVGGAVVDAEVAEEADEAETDDADEDAALLADADAELLALAALDADEADAAEVALAVAEVVSVPAAAVDAPAAAVSEVVAVPAGAAEALVGVVGKRPPRSCCGARFLSIRWRLP